jgi:hypothetical protein
MTFERPIDELGLASALKSFDDFHTNDVSYQTLRRSLYLAVADSHEMKTKDWFWSLFQIDRLVCGCSSISVNI